ncbi:MAG: hypothetical protein U0996_10390 [Planctomycetaceae bacterium]
MQPRWRNATGNQRLPRALVTGSRLLLFLAPPASGNTMLALVLAAMVQIRYRLKFPLTFWTVEIACCRNGQTDECKKKTCSSRKIRRLNTTEQSSPDGLNNASINAIRDEDVE